MRPPDTADGDRTSKIQCSPKNLQSPRYPRSVLRSNFSSGQTRSLTNFADPLDSDFAYPTVKDRLPVILTKVADTVCRMRPEVEEKHGEVSACI